MSQRNSSSFLPTPRAADRSYVESEVPIASGQEACLAAKAFTIWGELIKLQCYAIETNTVDREEYAQHRGLRQEPGGSSRQNCSAFITTVDRGCWLDMRSSINCTGSRSTTPLSISMQYMWNGSLGQKS